MNKTTVWVYDDLWEEGYRFDEILGNRYCFVERKFAKDESEALSFLSKAFNHIPKIKGTSTDESKFYLLNSKCCLVIKEDIFNNETLKSNQHSKEDMEFRRAYADSGFVYPG